MRSANCATAIMPTSCRAAAGRIPSYRRPSPSLDDRRTSHHRQPTRSTSPRRTTAIFANDQIQPGQVRANDTLDVPRQRHIDPTYNNTSNYTDHRDDQWTALSRLEGGPASRTVGVQTMGGSDHVDHRSARWQVRARARRAIRVVDGGVPGTPGLEGDVVINATELDRACDPAGRRRQ